MRYFDKAKRQLIYTGKRASPDFWADKFHIDDSIRNRIMRKKHSWVSRITKKYIKPQEGIILEGGCGTGIFVASLHNNGYRCIGIDNSPKIVGILNHHVPELDIRFGDVRKLPFSDNYFTGYWSLGVIEHFKEGYESIAQEMSRVIKDNGYLFLAFPYMSPLRKIKAQWGLYELWQKETPEDFYQFALNPNIVIEDIAKMGFTFIRSIPFDGIRGAMNEISILRPILKNLYEYKANSVIIRIIREFFSVILSPVTSHGVLLIFRKCNNI